jgi:hypothetical protein
MTRGAWGDQLRAGRPGRRLVTAAALGLALAGAAAALSAGPASAGAVRAASGAGRADGAAGAGRTAGAVRAGGAVRAADRPRGFWNGTDSSWIRVPGRRPFREPVIGGAYGGYFGMAGNWANLAGCHRVVIWSGANSAQANANYARHLGVGTGVYWFMGGPGVDPHYNGTAREAKAWGRRQAARTLADMAKRHVKYPVVFMDIEIPGNSPSYTPAPDNGWNTVYTSACSGVARAGSIPARIDRAVLNGYAAYLTGHSSYKAGVYSAPDKWAQIFGTHAAASIPNTYEWTYETFTSSLAHPPAGWCLTGSASSVCAQFFGGVTRGSKYALMWQWSGGGGSRNGVGDFDQIDANRTP